MKFLALRHKLEQNRYAEEVWSTDNETGHTQWHGMFPSPNLETFPPGTTMDSLRESYAHKSAAMVRDLEEYDLVEIEVAVTRVIEEGNSNPEAITARRQHIEETLKDLPF